ncbi:hypothetical protein N656DRAFT_773408 [Canariomyces notabilis]|uniref:Uncharacterized protein n=1 Tax=Canariomyces notabilis TaxID=2074819 RepID=A0AAN6TMM7_9PEZI|nr:hypothetical protein N656DRAFT_773408 [Canariomyces arenarius]
MTRPETEILVHIAAPARADDDRKYRALASAYFSFEPTQSISLTPGLSAQGCSERVIGYDTEGNGRELSRRYDIQAPLSTREAGVIESPMLSFRSAINNLQSPRLRRPGEGTISESQLSWQPPPSEVQDSMPDNDLAYPQYCTPTRILQHYTSMFDSSQSDLSPIAQRQAPQQTTPCPPHYESPVLTSPTRAKNDWHPVGVTETVEHATQSLDPVIKNGDAAVIPLSPVAGNKRPAPERSTQDAAEDTRVASSYPSQQDEQAITARAESEPPRAKRPRIAHDDPEPGKPLARSASDVGPRQDKPGSAHQSSSLQALDSLEIISPPPATADAELRPEDMITDVLASLARELNLEKRFKPQLQTRDLRPFERGYWLVDCGSWEPALKRSAWGFLADYLGKGAAGWGTSCKRDRDFSWIRLYCWGCVVGHLYLVLYLMSKRRVLYSGASWVGADGKAVIVMGTRPPLA